MRFRVFCDVAPCSHVEVDRRFRGAYCVHHQGDLMMEAVGPSETSINFNVTTWRYIPEDSTLYSHRVFISSPSVAYKLTTTNNGAVD
jgi:hypothetical protein